MRVSGVQTGSSLSPVTAIAKIKDKLKAEEAVELTNQLLSRSQARRKTDLEPNMQVPCKLPTAGPVLNPVVACFVTNRNPTGYLTMLR